MYSYCSSSSSRLPPVKLLNINLPIPVVQVLAITHQHEQEQERDHPRGIQIERHDITIAIVIATVERRGKGHPLDPITTMTQIMIMMI